MAKEIIFFLNILVVQSNSMQFIDERLSSSGPFTRPTHKYMNTQTHRCSGNAQKKPKQSRNMVM
jgi:hypothetical protein